MRRLILSGVLLAALVGAAFWYLAPDSNSGLILYSAEDYSTAAAHAFAARSGVPVTVVSLSTGALLARIAAEGNRPHWNLAWFDGAESAAGLAAAHLTGVVHADLDWNRLGRRLVPADEHWVPTGITLAGVFVVPEARYSGAPRTWRALASWHGRIGMNNPAISGPAFPILAALLEAGGGWPAGKSFVRTLVHNGMHIYAKNSNTLAALNVGNIDLALVQSSAGFAFAHAHPGFRVLVPDPAVALPSVIVVPRGLSGRRRTAVLRFVRYVMSPGGQAVRMGQGEADSLYWPLTRSVSRPRDDDLLPPVPVAVTVTDARNWGRRQAAMGRWFSALWGAP